LNIPFHLQTTQGTSSLHVWYW